MEYKGQSLKWVRTLIGESAKYATARQAYENLSFCHTDEDTEPPLGAVVWYDMEPYGDVGLYVGNYKALIMLEGELGLIDYDSDDYLGWSNGIAEG